MSNERLRSAMFAAGHTARSLGEAVATDPKTVERWVSTGRLPHRSNALAVAQALGKDVTHLWPQLETRPRRTRTSADAGGELLAIYAQRADVPLSTWRSMFEQARESIEIMVYAAVFLHEQIPGWNDLLRDRASEGCRVRILIGDPDSAAVRLRGEEEAFGHGIESRCRLARIHYTPLLDVPGIEVAQHSTTLYNSVYRADEVMLANAHIYGANAFANPVFHLRRSQEQGLFGAHAAGFDAVWKSADPIRD